VKVPFVDLKAQYHSIKSAIDEAIATTIEESAFIGGAPVKAFETAFAQLYGSKHFVSCANGTDSLYIAMRMLDLQPGDEVIVPSTSWISTSETVTQAGGRPVFVDIDPNYYTIDTDQIEAKITAKTKGIIPVHIYGQMADMEHLSGICQKYNLWMIEDAAQSHFSEYKGQRAGLFGVVGSFSFFPGKNLGAYGDAGGMTVQDEALARRLKMYATHGALVKHQHQMEGINSRLDALQARILSAKLPHILKWTDQRIANADYYNQILGGIEEIQLPSVRPDTKHTFHLYVIKTKKRDALQHFLEENGISTAVHYPSALTNLPAYGYMNLNKNDYPVSNGHQAEALSIPMYPELEPEQMNYVAEKIKDFFYANR
jgi:dTDP-4-amino-4,6-dideoxygalactose transaminase